MKTVEINHTHFQKERRRCAYLFKNFQNWHLYLLNKILRQKGPLRFIIKSGISIDVPQQLLFEFKESFMDVSSINYPGFVMGDSPVVLDIGVTLRGPRTVFRPNVEDSGFKGGRTWAGSASFPMGGQRTHKG